MAKQACQREVQVVYYNPTPQTRRAHLRLMLIEAIVRLTVRGQGQGYTVCLYRDSSSVAQVVS